MYNWLIALLLFFGFGAAVVNHDYVGDIAAEAAYASLLPSKPGVKRVNPADCKTCGGTGRVRTGDDQGWTKCPDCQPPAAQPSK